MLELIFLVHLTQVAIGTKNEIQIKNNILGPFFRLPRGGFHPSPEGHTMAPRALQRGNLKKGAMRFILIWISFLDPMATYVKCTKKLDEFQFLTSLPINTVQLKDVYKYIIFENVL